MNDIRYIRREAFRGDFRGFGSTYEEFAGNLERHVMTASTPEEIDHARYQVSIFLGCGTITPAQGNRILGLLEVRS